MYITPAFTIKTYSMSLKALIIDDEEFARKNLQILIEDHCQDIDVVGEADGKQKR